MHIDELLDNYGFDSTCYDCQYGAHDEAVNYRSCECPDDELCPRLPLDESKLKPVWELKFY